jgi:PST family polysaccharide transporter
VWAGLAAIVPRFATPVVMITLARLLTPEDYGVVAIATLLLALLGVLQQMGLGQAVVQVSERLEQAASTAFWVTLVMSALLYAVLWLAAPTVASFFHEPRSLAVLRVLGVQLLVGGSCVIPTALLQRRLAFRTLFFTQSLPALLPFAISIPMAAGGAGYWALVTGAITGSVMGAALVWTQVRWRPRLAIDFELLPRLLRFGAFVLLEALIGWAVMYLDNVVLGHRLAAHDLGVYVLAFSLATAAVAMTSSGITAIALPAFSRLQHDLSRVRAAYLQALGLVMAFATPAALGLALIGEPLAQALYGPRWRGLGTVLSILALYAGIGQLWSINADVYKAIGRPEVTPRVYACVAPFLLVVFFVAAPFGVVIFSAVRVGASCATAILHVWTARRVLGLPRGYVLRVMRGPALAGMAMVVVVGLARWLLPSAGPGALTTLVLLGITSYVAALRLAEPTLVAGVYHDFMHLLGHSRSAPVNSPSQ